MASQEQFPVDLVVVSPLQRAIQTALIVFNSTNRIRPNIAVEKCRKTLGVHTCDKRHNVSYLSTAFPSVNFTSITDGTDPLLTSTHQETEAELQARVQVFFQEMYSNRISQFMAVASHNGFISACL